MTNQSGPNNPNWKGGVAADNMRYNARVVRVAREGPALVIRRLRLISNSVVIPKFLSAIGGTRTPTRLSTGT